MSSFPGCIGYLFFLTFANSNGVSVVCDMLRHTFPPQPAV
jgi:hypothetical protein